MYKGIVVSDLHLLSRRSEGQLRFDEVSAQFSALDTLVLNGDIFDFRWAIRPHSESVPQAIDWLHQLKSAFPQLAIHFIPGNHDCLPGFLDQVEATEGVSLHPHHLILGRKLFLHGDAATYRMNRNGFQKFRSGWEKDRPRSHHSARLYDLSDAIKISHLTHHLWFGKDSTIRRMIWHLDQTYSNWKEEIDECFFGHTHIPLRGVEREGVKFHNTGSAIRGQKFAPAEFTHPSNSMRNLKFDEE